jgi:hypothetical protein
MSHCTMVSVDQSDLYVTTRKEKYIGKGYSVLFTYLRGTSIFNKWGELAHQMRLPFDQSKGFIKILYRKKWKLPGP